MPREVSLLIDGQWRRGSHSFAIQGPLGGSAGIEVSAASAEEVEEALASAARAQPLWAHIGPSHRRDVLEQAAANLESRRSSIVALMAEECGASSAWANFNVSLGVDMLREAARLAFFAAGGWTIPSSAPGLEARASRRPVGTALAIAPWNAPVILGVRSVAVPLVCGNSVVMKGSELSPGVHAEVARAINDAKPGAGVISYLVNSPEDAAEFVGGVIADPRIRHVNFTGSTSVGRAVAVSAARHLKRSVLELGGKAAAIVLADADIDLAVDAITFGAFMNTGQICMSTERILVEGPIRKPLVDRLVARASILRVGDPRDPSVDIGPLINLSSRERAAGLIQDALDKGATLEFGGVGEGLELSPTVLSDVTPEMRVFSEETFAPIVCVVEVNSLEHALELANSSEYGLSSSIFTRDYTKASYAVSRLEVGICHVNSATVHDEPQMPFGGVKSSGWGRFGGEASVAEFTDIHWETLQSGARQYPI